MSHFKCILSVKNANKYTVYYLLFNSFIAIARQFCAFAFMSFAVVFARMLKPGSNHTFLVSVHKNNAKKTCALCHSAYSSIESL